MRYLIVNADDYGFSPEVARGIREAHLHGIVTSTTAMLNRPSAPDALLAAAATTPRLGLGVHLTLTTGRPLLPPGQVRSLVDQAGRFFKPGPLAAHAAAVDLSEIRAEWRAQIELFCGTLGHGPDHLDSHHHTSYWPGLFDIMLDLAAEYGCPIRSPVSDNATAEPDASEPDRAWLDATLRLLAARPVARPDHMLTAFYGDDATLENLLHILDSLPDGVTEIMSHPGYCDEVLLQESSYNRQRERELSILTSARIRSRLEELGIQLISFAGLVRASRGDSPIS